MRNLLTPPIAALPLMGGCSSSDDDGPTGGDGGAVEGVVQHLIFEGEPVAGIAVGTPGGATDASDAEGRSVSRASRPPTTSWPRFPCQTAAEPSTRSF